MAATALVALWGSMPISTLMLISFPRCPTMCRCVEDIPTWGSHTPLLSHSTLAGAGGSQAFLEPALKKGGMGQRERPTGTLGTSWLQTTGSWSVFKQVGAGSDARQAGGAQDA